MAPTTPAPTQECHGRVDSSTTYRCGNIGPGAADDICALPFILEGCANTCCNLLRPRRGELSIAGRTVYYKGSFAKGVVEVVVRYSTDYTGRVDLRPVIEQDGVMWGSATIARNDLDNLPASGEVRVKVFLLSAVPDGAYSLRFTVRPTGATYADRFQNLDDALFGFVLINDYIKVASPGSTYQLTQGALPENILVVAAYKSHAPVRIAANLFCDPRDCGEEASARGGYVLSNRYSANLYPPSAIERGALLTIRVAKKISDGSLSNSTSWRWRLQLTMGLYEEDTNNWVQTIGRSALDEAHVLPFAGSGAATGVMAARGNGEAASENDKAASGSSTAGIAIAALGAVLVAAVAVVMVAAHRRQIAQKRAAFVSTAAASAVIV